MSFRRTLFPFVAALLSLAACVSSVPPEREDWRHSDVTAHYPLRASTDWVANSPAWQQAAADSYVRALRFVTKEARHRAPGSWAVVLDIDETVISNVEYFIALDRKGQRYNEHSWRDWAEERSAAPVPNAFTFLHRVQDLGGQVAFVSNRMEYLKDATVDNLSMYGLVYGRDYNVILLRRWPDGESLKDPRYVEAQRLLSKEAHRPVEVIAYVGDQVSDRPAQPGSARFFCIPQGGLYGEPCAPSRIPAAVH